MTATLTSDITALCLALDAADEADVAHLLAAMADAMEEAGDGRAAGLRDNLAWAPYPAYRPATAPDGAWHWHRGRMELRERGFVWHIPEHVFDRLPGVATGDVIWLSPTRSAAFLALAEALS